MKKSLLLLSVIPLLIVACDSSSSGKKDPHSEQYYKVNFDAALINDKEGKPVKISYDLPLSYLSFDKPGTTYNKQLAITSFVGNTICSNKDVLTSYYGFFGFDDITFSTDYDIAEDSNTLKYSFAHHENVIAVFVSGINYKKPWENNFTLGETGNAQGFQSGAIKLLDGLDTYLNKYKDTQDLKLWMSGYSRGAAVANIATLSLLENKVVDEDHLYSYLFETPRGIDKSNVKECKSIFNIINSADLVTYVAPEAYDLYRCGQEIDLYSKNADSILKDFNKDLVLSKFTVSSSNYKNESELINYLINGLTAPKTGTVEYVDISTRSNYFHNIQNNVLYLISLFFSIKSSTSTDIMTEFSKLSIIEKASLLAEDGAYNFLKPILYKNEETYDDNVLKESLAKFVTLVSSTVPVLMILTNEAAISSVLRCVQFHAPECILPLLIKSN